MAKSLVSDYMMPHKSPMERFQCDYARVHDNPRVLIRETCILRGWLNVEQTDALLALLEEDDCNLHAVLLAAGLLSLTRTLQFQDEQEKTNMTNSLHNSASGVSHSNSADSLHKNIR